MRRRLAAFLLVLAGCSAAPTIETPTPQLMAAALDHLVSVDHTFGSGPPPFTTYLIEEQTITLADFPALPDQLDLDTTQRRPLTDGERSAIEQALEKHGELRWISDPDQWRTEDLIPRIEGSAIVAVGEPIAEGDDYLVPVSLWCGGLCGTWLTYRLENLDGIWRVTGTEGPIAIS